MTQENIEQLELQELHAIAEKDHPTPHKRPHTPGGMKEMLGIAVPMMISLSFDSVMTFIDRIFLSRLGSEVMSAAMGGGVASFTTMTFFFGLIGYSTALVAQKLGAGQIRRAPRVIDQALIIAIIAWPLMLLASPLMKQVFIHSGIDARQLEHQLAYYSILMLGAIIPLCRHAFASFFSGIGETRVIMIASFTGLVVNAALDWVLIFGRFGAPAMGIRGAAIATLIGGFCSLVVLAIQYYRKSMRRRFGIRFALRFDAKSLRSLLRFGTPAGLELFLNLLAFQGMITVFHSRGLDVAAAATIMFNWDMVTFIPLLGIEVGVTSLVGRYVGAKKPAAIRRAIRSGLFIGWIFTAFVFAAFLGLPEYLVNFFRPEHADAAFTQAYPLAVFMIKVASIYILIEAIMVVFAGALRGAGDTFWTMNAMVVIHWILVGALWLMLIRFGMSGQASWVILVMLFMAFPSVLWLRWRSGRWKKALVSER